MTTSPAPDLNLARFIGRRAAHAPDSVAIIYEGGNLTSAQLESRTGALAAALVDRGVEPMSRVAYLGMNSTSFLATMIAAARIGAIFVPFNFRLAATEVAEVLWVARASVLICEEGPPAPRGWSCW